MAEAAAPSLPMMPNTENIRKIRDVILEKQKPDEGPSKGGSITDLSGELGGQLKPVVDMLARIRNVLDNISGSIAFLSGQLLDAMSAKAEAEGAAAAEENIESARGPAEVGAEADEKEVGVTVTQQAQGLFSTIFSGLKLLLAGKVLMDFLKINFPTLAEGIDEFFKNLVAGIRSFATPAFVTGIASIFKGIGSALKGLKNMLKPAVMAIDVAGDAGKAIGPIGKFFGSVGKFFGALKNLIPFAKTIPGLNLIFGIIDIFKGFGKGEEEFGGVIGGIIGSIRELLIGFIGLPLDLLKKGVAFILKKLGFEDMAEKLESFSFAELISDMVTGLVNFFKNFFTNIKKLINKIAKFIPGFDGFDIGAEDLSKEEREKERADIESGAGDEEARKKAIEAFAEADQAAGKEATFESKRLGINKDYEDLTPEQKAMVDQQVEASKAERLQQLDAADQSEEQKVVQENQEEQKKLEEKKAENIKKDEEKIQETEEKLAKGPETGMGSELKEKGQTPEVVALSNANQITPTNVDNSTKVNNNTQATQITRTPPNIVTRNDDSSLFGAVASTYTV